MTWVGRTTSNSLTCVNKTYFQTTLTPDPCFQVLHSQHGLFCLAVGAIQWFFLQSIHFFRRQDTQVLNRFEPLLSTLNLENRQRKLISLDYKKNYSQWSKIRQLKNLESNVANETQNSKISEKARRSTLNFFKIVRQSELGSYWNWISCTPGRQKRLFSKQ